MGVPKGQKFTPIYELAILSHAIGHFDVKRANSPNKHIHFQVGWGLHADLKEIPGYAFRRDVPIEYDPDA